jgi:hypothetical protein
MTLLLDTSAFLTLVATDELAAIVRDLSTQVIVCEITKADTLLLLETTDEHALVPMNVESVLAFSNIATCALEAAEAELFIRAARTLPDPEAMAVTIAATRAYGLCTDDDKVRATYARIGGNEARCLSTPAMLHRWTSENGVPEERVRRAANRARARACFQPRTHDPFAAWWNRLTS